MKFYARMFGWYACSGIRLWILLIRFTHLVKQSVLNIWSESTSIEKTVLPLECDLRPIDLTSLVSIIRAPQPLGWGPVRNRVPQQGVNGGRVKLHLLLSTPLLALLPEAPCLTWKTVFHETRLWCQKGCRLLSLIIHTEIPNTIPDRESFRKYTLLIFLFYCVGYYPCSRTVRPGWGS